jgi:hypothetical protein
VSIGLPRISEKSNAVSESLKRKWKLEFFAVSESKEWVHLGIGTVPSAFEKLYLLPSQDIKKILAFLHDE